MKKKNNEQEELDVELMCIQLNKRTGEVYFSSCPDCETVETRYVVCCTSRIDQICMATPPFSTPDEAVHAWKCYNIKGYANIRYAAADWSRCWLRNCN